MKKSILIITTLFLGFSGLAQKKKDLIKEVANLKAQKTELQAKLTAFEKAKEVNLKDSLQNFSYAFGVSIGNNLKTIGFDSIAYNTFSVAIEDAIKGNEKIPLQMHNASYKQLFKKRRRLRRKRKVRKAINF